MSWKRVKPSLKLQRSVIPKRVDLYLDDGRAHAHEDDSAARAGGVDRWTVCGEKSRFVIQQGNNLTDLLVHCMVAQGRDNTGCSTNCVNFDTPLFSDMLMNQAALLRAEQAMEKVWFFEKNIELLFVSHGQAQVRAQPDFQAQPGFQQIQVHVLRRYSTFWPENHFTW